MLITFYIIRSAKLVNKRVKQVYTLEHPAVGGGGFLVDTPINKISIVLEQDLSESVYYKYFLFIYHF